jgi:hypothetical protein
MAKETITPADVGAMPASVLNSTTVEAEGQAAGSAEVQGAAASDGLSDSERNLANAIASGSTIVGATGTAVGRQAGGGALAENYAKARENAMVAATVKAAEDGITDPDVIKALKAEALSAVEAEWATVGPVASEGA